jgi:amino acid transporter
MRHVQLIAISGSIGSALFVSIGNPLTGAGPLGLLLGVGIWSIVVWAASNCLIEMTSLLPVDGGFVTFATRFVDRSFGTALGWNVSAGGVIRHASLYWYSYRTRTLAHCLPSYYQALPRHRLDGYR